MVNIGDGFGATIDFQRNLLHLSHFSFNVGGNELSGDFIELAGFGASPVLETGRVVRILEFIKYFKNERLHGPIDLVRCARRSSAVARLEGCAPRAFFRR